MFESASRQKVFAKVCLALEDLFPADARKTNRERTPAQRPLTTPIADARTTNRESQISPRKSRKDTCREVAVCSLPIQHVCG